jgi:hypothetical protein
MMLDLTALDRAGSLLYDEATVVLVLAEFTHPQTE